MKGYIQVYTGDGKGKTTAALGLALRAAGANMFVFIGQFMKCGDYSEIKSLQQFFDFIRIEQFGRKRRVGQGIEEDDRKYAQEGISRIRKIMHNEKYDLVILDEINVALSYELIDEEELIDIIKKRPPGMEVVLTGRDASPGILRLADLVTEMKIVKHYKNKGVTARVGIEK